MKKLIVIFASLISTACFCQTADSLTAQEQKAAIDFLRKQLPNHYQNVPMVYRKNLVAVMDSLDKNEIISTTRCYTFDNKCICDSSVVMEINSPGGNGRFPKREYIYYKFERKNSEYIGVYMVSGD